MAVSTDCLNRAPAPLATTSRRGRPRPRHARVRGGLLLPVSMVISFLAASAAPTPLWAHYGAVWHGTALTTTVAFALYAVAVLLGLLILGEASNHLGRTPVLLGALAGQAVAVLLFAAAESYLPIFIGRVLQGLAAGAALGTLGAAMIEAHRERGTLASSVAPGLGTGSGSLLAGLLVGYLPWPTHLVYLVLLAVFALQAVVLLRMVDGSPRKPGLRASLRPSVAVPPSARAAFVSVAPVLFAIWALPGFFGSLGPVLLREISHSPSVLLGGLGLFLLAGVAAVATVALSGRSTGVTMIIGIAGLLIGVAALLWSIAAGSVVGFLIAVSLAGIGFGSAFQGGVRTVVPLVDPSDRPGLLSAIYLVSYAGLGLPAVVAGVLVSQGFAVRDVAFDYLIGVLVLTVLAGVALIRIRLTRTRA